MIAVGLRRKIIIYKWESLTSLSTVSAPACPPARPLRRADHAAQAAEFPTASSPKTMVWAGAHLFVGTNKDYRCA
jgi:hypothetical protein